MPKLLFSHTVVGTEEPRGQSWGFQSTLPTAGPLHRVQPAQLPGLIPRLLSLCSVPPRTWGQPKRLSGLPVHSASGADATLTFKELAALLATHQRHKITNPQRQYVPQKQPSQAEPGFIDFPPSPHCFRNFNSLSPLQGKNLVLQRATSNL